MALDPCLSLPYVGPMGARIVLEEPRPHHYLRECREAADMSQSELARRAGCHESHISRTESGKRAMSRALAEDVARVLGVSAKSLLEAAPFAAGAGRGRSRARRGAA